MSLTRESSLGSRGKFDLTKKNEPKLLSIFLFWMKIESKRKATSNLSLYDENSSSRSAPFLETTAEAATTSNNTTRSKRLKGLVNNEYCNYCDEGGSLINCDRCPASFHLLCHEPPLDEIPKGDFICNRCKYSLTKTDGQLASGGAKNGLKFFELLIEPCKSKNPRQMQLSEELSKKCDLKIPGLNRVKWWIHEKCKLFDSSKNSSNNTSSNLNTNSSNGNQQNNKNSSSKQQISLFGSQSSSQSSQSGQSLPLYEQATNLIKDYRAKKNATEQNEQLGNICFTCRK